MADLTAPHRSVTAGTLRFLNIPAPRGAAYPEAPATAPDVVLSFRDGSSERLDGASPAGRAFRALAEVLALRSRTARAGEET